jgi:hypothetical protein
MMMMLSYAQEIILKRAADLAEALYSMPRNSSGGGASNGQLTTATNGSARTPPSSMTGGLSATGGGGGGGVGVGSGGFGPYTSQLTGVAGATALPPVAPDGSGGQWDNEPGSGWSHRYPAFTF